MSLAGGLQLRTASERDLPQIEDLLAARGDAADAVDLRLVVHDPDEGLEACAVVVDGDRVVSTATLLHETVIIDDCPVPTGQVELVATHIDYERRGLVRALMGWAHERSSARGDLLQVMIGIPYFYRQFGYSYSMPHGLVRKLLSAPPVDPEVTVREATFADIDAMDTLQHSAQAAAEVRMPHSRACWRWLIDRDGSTQWVAERGGQVIATCRTTPPEEGVVVGELAGDRGGIAALVAHARSLGEASVFDRPWSDDVRPLDSHLDMPTGPKAIPDWYYARVPDLAALLTHLEPVLIERLESAGLIDQRQDVLLSTWKAQVRFTIGRDGMGPVTTGGPEQYPTAKGGSAIPPDAIPRLLLGPEGATGLEALLPDAWLGLGPQRDLMAALFPPVRADLLTFYLPV